MRTVGLIGGMSWESSLTYYQRINTLVKERLGGLHSARLVLYSVDFHTIEALQRRGDWDEAGVAMRGSHASLRDDYEVSCAEVDTLVSLCDRIPSASSIYGARMTGGGFGGCIVALVKTEDVEKVAQELLDSYCQETGIETTYLVTRAGEGARILYQA